MSNIKLKLNNLPLNQEGIIYSINIKNKATKRRLLDLGLIQGTKIIPVFASALR